MNIRTVKFGGTSMGSADAMMRVVKILKDMPEKKVAVVSAVSGTTDALIVLGRAAVNKKRMGAGVVRTQK